MGPKLSHRGRGAPNLKITKGGLVACPPLGRQFGVGLFIFFSLAKSLCPGPEGCLYRHPSDEPVGPALTLELKPQPAVYAAGYTDARHMAQVESSGSLPPCKSEQKKMGGGNHSRMKGSNFKAKLLLMCCCMLNIFLHMTRLYIYAFVNSLLP